MPLQRSKPQVDAQPHKHPAEITCAYNIDVRVDERAHETPEVIAGPPEALAERLGEFVDIGFSAFNFMLAAPNAAEQAERLATEVMPALRAR